ncbi:threonine/serine exporter family protein [Konateibacter massiliensis]|uniref:threonine/serine exporter family protein n=1 Tax=Konateibacter massiliensis TaxID=2002841 RepID=UPI000C149B10|nr:threonine/serine exporter family protein [Konateibacter massiliensis]
MTIIIQTLGAFFAVVGFCGIMEAPKKFRFWSGAAGSICWFIYLTVLRLNDSKLISAFLSSLAVAFFAHMAARRLKAPMTVFLIPGILPLVPGGSIYYSVYYLIQNNSVQATYYLMETLQIAGAIALAVFLMDSFFRHVRKVKTQKSTG